MRIYLVWALSLPAVALGFVLVVLLQRAAEPKAAGDSDGPADAAEARDGGSQPAPRPSLGWEEAKALARTRNVPILMLAARSGENCGPAAEAEAVYFSEAALRRLETCCVPVRHMIDPMSPGSMELLNRYAPRMAHPALLVLTAEGELLHAQVGRLYGLYGRDHQPYGDPVPRLTLEEVCGVVADAVARAEATRARLARLMVSERLPDRLEAAEILIDGFRAKEAADVLSAWAEAVVPPEHVNRLARALERAGADESAMSVRRRALAQHPDSPERRRWGFDQWRAFTKRGIKPPPDVPLPSAVLDDLRKRPDPALEMGVRFALGEAAVRAGDQETLAQQLAWFARRVGEIPGGPSCAAKRLGAWAKLARSGGRPATALVWFRTLLAKYPDDNDAQWLKHGVLAVLEREAAADTGS